MKSCQGSSIGPSSNRLNFSSEMRNIYNPLDKNVSTLDCSYMGISKVSFRPNQAASFWLSYYLCNSSNTFSLVLIDLEGATFCGSIPCVDYLHLVVLAGWLEQAWALGSPWGALCPRMLWQGGWGWSGPRPGAVSGPRGPWWSS